MSIDYFLEIYIRITGFGFLFFAVIMISLNALCLYQDKELLRKEKMKQWLCGINKGGIRRSGTLAANILYIIFGIILINC